MNKTPRCLVVPGNFLPFNDTVTQLLYKQLRLLNMQYDVIALRNTEDSALLNLLHADPNYSKFSISYADDYSNIYFSINNVNLFKCLRHMNRYVDTAVKAWNGHEYVVTSSWPCYTIRAGLAIKKAHPEVKWIASFCDPINHSPYKFDNETYASYSLPEKAAFNLYLHYFVVDADEAHAFESADLLVFICEEQRDFMITQYLKYFHNVTEEEIRRKCVIVPLNYVPEWKEFRPEPFVKKEETFVLSHFGRVYGLRIIQEFIYAFEMFIRKHPDTRIRVEQYGEFRKSDLDLIRKLGLSYYFTVHDKIPYSECIEKQKSSDAVLLFDTILPDDQIQPYLPSKILEYSILRKNVLAVTTPKSPSYRILKESNAIACRYDRNDILRGLEELVIEHRPSLINYATPNSEAVKPLQEAIDRLNAG